VRILARRYGKTRKTVIRAIHRITASLPDSAFIQRRFLPRWSGVLVFDGKVVRVYDKLSSMLKNSSFSEDELRWMNKMRWLIGVDHGTGDLPHYDIAKEESRIDLILYFRMLKELGYPLKALICDGNEEIPRAAKFVFGDDVIIQLCTRHFMEGLRRLIGEEQEPRRRAKLDALLRHIQGVIEAKDIERANERQKRLISFSRTIRHPLKETVMQTFHRHEEELTAHLLHPKLKLPHTSNDAENLIRQLNQRLKSLGRFFHQSYARDYLNAWMLLRRFTPFTDCKGTRTYRNGKAPLELAGCDIKHIDPLSLRQEPR